MNVLVPKKITERVTSTATSNRNGPHRSVPAARAACLAGAVCRWWRSSTNPVRTAGGMNSTVAPRPIAPSAGVARTGARKNPTLPPVAKMLIADVLSPAAYRAALPAAGWNIATPSPDANSVIHTSAYPCRTPDIPRPMPARLTPAPAIQLREYRSTRNPTTS